VAVTVKAIKQQDIGIWMKANGESIYGTRPWKVFGEGPAQQKSPALSAQGFNEGKGVPFSDKDIRFAVKEKELFATVMAWPAEGSVLISSLAEGSSDYPEKISNVHLLATKENLRFERNSQGLKVYFPADQPEASYANALKIT